MLRIIGAGLIVSAFTMAGQTVAHAFAARPRQLRVLQSAINELETEIVYGAVPMKEALERLTVRGDSLVRKLYSEVLAGLEEDRGCTLADAWAAGLNKWQNETFLTSDDLATLRVLGNSLGISDREDQKKHLILAKEKLAQSETTAWENAQRAVKPWNYMGFLGGLIIVLIFL